MSEIPYESFVNLCGGIGEKKDEKQDNLSLVSVRLFKTIDEFSKLSAEELNDIDTSQNIRVMKNGNFLVFLK